MKSVQLEWDGRIKSFELVRLHRNSWTRGRSPIFRAMRSSLRRRAAVVSSSGIRPSARSRY